MFLHKMLIHNALCDVCYYILFSNWHTFTDILFIRIFIYGFMVYLVTGWLTVLSRKYLFCVLPPPVLVNDNMSDGIHRMVEIPVDSF